MTNCHVARATPADYPAMAEIWRVCFGDDPSYIQFFFRRRLPSCLALMAQTDGKTVGAVYLLPAEIYDSGTYRRAYYVYALGVLPEYRGRGIASDMMRHIFGICKEENAVCFLKPAVPSLAKFYAGLGMKPTHFAAEKRYPAVSAKQCLSWAPLAPADYAARRLAAPPLPGGVLWDLPGINYAVGENKFSGGFCLTCDTDRGEAAVLGRREGDLLRIEDCIAADPAAILSQLCTQFGVKEAILRVPADPSAPDAFLIGMTYNMNAPASGPLGLLLD